MRYVVYGVFCCENLNGLFVQFVFDCIEVGNWLFELNVFVGILYGSFSVFFSIVYIECVQFKVANIQGIEGNKVIFVNFVQYVFFRYFYVFKEDLMGGRVFDVQFFFFCVQGQFFRIVFYD